MKKFLLLTLALLLSVWMMGQSTANYTFSSATNGSLTDMTGSTDILVPTTVTGDFASAVTNIGFTFYFMGLPYTQYSVNSNGQMRLGATVVGTAYSNSQATASDLPFLNAFWDDLDNASDLTSSRVRAKLTGGVGSHVLTVEWKDFAISHSASVSTNLSKWQIRLYEATGAIEYVYGNMEIATGSGTVTASIGFTNTSADGGLVSVTSITTPAVTTLAASVVNTLVNSATVGQIASLSSSADGSRKIYSFTPTYASTPANPITMSFSSVTAVGMTVSWIDNSTSETFFTVTRALDAGFTTGVVTSVVASTTPAATGTTYNSVQSGLAPGTTYYYKVTAGNEAYPSSSGLTGNRVTNAPGAISSTATGGNWNTGGTWVGGVVPTAGDDVTIVNGATVVLDAAGTCYNLTVGTGTTGILEMKGFTLTVNNSMTIAAGGTTRMNATVSTAGNISIGLNLTNNGTLDLYSSATNYARITFTGTTDASFTLNTGSTTDLDAGSTSTRGVIISKGTSYTPVLSFVYAGGTFTIQGVTPVLGCFYISNGTLKIAGSVALSNPVFGVAAYSIPATGGFWLNNANFTVAGLAGSPSNSGLLRITAGTYNIGTATGNSLGSGANSVYLIEGGIINVAGRFNLTSAGVNYTQTGGTLTVQMIGNSSSSSAGFGITSSSGTYFTMSNGTIIFQLASTGSTQYDYYNIAFNLNITGGTLQFGNAASVSAKTFRLYGYAPSTVINGTYAHTVRLGTGTGAGTTGAYIFGDLTLNTNTTLNCYGYYLFLLGNTVNNGAIVGTTTYDRVDFMGLAAQSYSGTGTFGTLAAPFTGVGVGVANTSGVTLNSAIYTTRVNLFTGPFYNSNKFYLGIGGTSSVYIQRGGGTDVAGTFDVAPNFNVGSGGLTVNYYTASNAVTTGYEIPSTRTLNSLVINNTNGVTLSGGALSTAAMTMTLGNLTTSSTNLLTVTGTTVAAITYTAGYINGPLARTLPAGLTGTFTYLFPLGKSAYKPLELVNPITTAGGTVVVQSEVFDANCGGTPGANMSALNTNRYWNASVTSTPSYFTSTTVRLTEAGLTSTNGMAKSATVNGTYDLVSSTVPTATTIISNTITSLGYFVVGTKSVPMSFTSSTTTQASTATVLQNSTNQAILGIQVVTTDNANPLSITKFTVNATGTTAVSDISNAKIWSTGNSSTFAATTQFGSTIASPLQTSFDITDSKELLPGTNYFWLTYDIPLAATSTHVVDGQCTNITVATVDHAPTVTAPAGSRTITLDPPTALTPTVISSSEIDLAWTKNSVGQNVMVAMNSTNTFGTPANGTPYVETNPLPTAGTVIYNGPASGYNHRFLNPLTAYYYKAWSVDASNYYSSTGPTANATTLCASGTITETFPATRCGTGTVNLRATASSGTLAWYTALTGGTSLGTGSPWTTPSISSTTTFYVGAETYTLGNITLGAGASTSTGSESPFYHLWGGHKSQFLVKASELSAAGLSAGNITALSFDVVASTGMVFQGFNLSVGQTALTALTTSFVTGLTNVYTTTAPAGVTPVNGIFTITFASPFNWDGSSNIVVETCWSNNNSGSSANSATVKYDATSFVSNAYYRADNLTPSALCGTSTGSSTNSSRPKMIFAGQSTCSSPRSAVIATVTPTPALTITPSQSVCNNAVAAMTVTSTISDYDAYVWTPAANLYTNAEATLAYTPGSSATTVYAKTATAGAIIYTCSASNAALCANTAISTVTVREDISITVLASANPICANSPTTLTGLFNYSGTTPSYIAPPAVTNPVSDEDLGNVTFGSLNNTTAINSLAGSIGTATGTAGSYSNFTAFGPYNFTAGNSYPLSVSTITTGSSYSNAIGVYIDYNRNGVFTDAGEAVYLSGSTTSGPHTETANITIPGTVSSGATRMRVIVNELGLVTGPTMTVGYGEYEDYTLNISNYGVGYTYSWSNGSTVIGTTNPLINSPAESTIYTLTVTDPNLCSKTASTSVTVSSGALITTQPVSVIKCAGQTASFTVEATGPGLTYQWQKNYTNIPIGDNASAGTPTLTLTGVASADADNYEVVVASSCGTPVTSNGLSTLTVNPVPVSGASSNSPVCSGSSINLSGTTSIPGATFSWTGPNGFASTDQNPAITNASTAASGAYYLTTTASGCASATVNTSVIVNVSPTAVTIVPASATLPSGAIQQLDASGGIITGAVILSENFNGATNGWTKINNSTGGTDPTLAVWTLTPDAYVYKTYGTWHSNDNSQFYLSNSDAPGSGVTTATILQSPSFSTVGFTVASLSFYHYYKSNAQSAKVDYSIDGTNWVNLKTYSTTTGLVGAFAQENIALPAGALNHASVYIRFKYDDSWGYFWGIDNVSITGTGSAPITWAPNDDLYTNAEATIGYTGTGNHPTVWTMPVTTRTYTATATSAAGCPSSQTVTVTSCPAAPFRPDAAVTSNSAHLTWGYIEGNMPVNYTIDVATDDLFASHVAGYPVMVANSVYDHNVAGLAGNTMYYFKITANGASGCTNQFSDGSFATCPAVPGTPVASFRTPDGFTLTWTAPAGGSAATISYIVEVADNPGFSTPVSYTVTNPVVSKVITGLYPSTLYYFRVKASTDCNSDYTSPGTVTTLCPETVAPLSENFSSVAFPPSCWTNTPVSGTNLWARSSSSHGSGTGSAFANFYAQESGTYQLGTMPIDLRGMVTPKLKFDFAYATFTEEVDEMDVYYSTTYGSTWTLLLAMPGGASGILNTAGATTDPFVPTAAQWRTHSMELPAGTNMLKFTAISAYGNNLYLDNITVESPPIVASGAATDLTASGATLHGTVDAYYKSTAATFEFGTTPSYGLVYNADQTPVTGHVTTPVSHTVNGLLANTTYHYRAAGTSSAGTAYGLDETFVTLPAPTLSGPASACNGSTGNVYTTEAGNSGYDWHVTGGIITDGGTPADHTATVTWNTVGSQSVSVNYNNAAGHPALAAASYPVTVNPFPVAAGSITGTSSVRQEQTGVVYAVAPIDHATGYLWSLPAGASITAGDNTYSITVSFSDLAVSGVITVQGTNACGNGPVSPDFNLTVLPPVPFDNNLQNVEVHDTRCYNATQTIFVAGIPPDFLTTFDVAAEGQVEMIAGQNIIYYPGTHVVGYMWGHIGTGYCGSKAATIITVADGVDPVLPATEKSYFTLYPNPTSGNFTLVQKGDKVYETVKVDVYTMSGEKILTEQMIGEKRHEFRFSEIPSGLYFVKVVADGYVETMKLVKTR